MEDQLTLKTKTNEELNQLPNQLNQLPNTLYNKQRNLHFR